MVYKYGLSWALQTHSPLETAAALQQLPLLDKMMPLSTLTTVTLAILQLQGALAVSTITCQSNAVNNTPKCGLHDWVSYTSLSHALAGSPTVDSSACTCSSQGLASGARCAKSSGYSEYIAWIDSSKKFKLCKAVIPEDGCTC